MSWSTDDGLHEGYLLPEFTDGRRGLATTGGGVPSDQVIVNVEYVENPTGGIPDTRFTTRPAAEAVGWRIMCDCRTPVDAGGYGGSLLPEADRWASELLVRVPSASLEDLAEGRIFAPDEDVPYLDGRDDVATMIRDRWWREHAGGLDALIRITEARARLTTADRELDAAVATARESGVSWEAIGRAAGMARQSAHARWGPSTSPERRAEIAAARRRINDAVAELAVLPLDRPAADAMRRRLAEPDLQQAGETLRAAQAAAQRTDMPGDS